MSENKGLAVIKDYGRSPEIIERFAEIVGKNNAGGYVQSAILAVANNDALQKCSPASIFSSALRAATVQLLCEPSLGQAYLVPFKGKATFLIGYKGLYQLALRTGKYRYINVSPIYEGETITEDRFSGLMSLGGGRKSDVVIGYIAGFKLLSGFSKSLYMTIDEIHAHANEYSMSYNHSSSPWKTHRPEMERKTVLRLLLSKYGYIDPKDALAISGDADNEIALDDPDGMPENVTIIEGECKDFDIDDANSELGFDNADIESVTIKVDNNPYSEYGSTLVIEPTAIEEFAEEVGAERTLAMSLESAKAVKSSDGSLYGDASDEELNGKLIGVRKALKKEVTPERKEELLFKRDAILTIQNSRLQSQE